MSSSSSSEDVLPAAPIIPATSPSSPPDVTYNRWWLNLVVCPPHPDQPMPATVTLRKYGVDEDGLAHFAPDVQPVSFRVDDLNEEMMANPLVAEAFGLVIEATASMAHVRGLI